MEKENMSEAEGMLIIESMINKAKNQFSENGFMYLVWGWVILICSVSQYILQYVVHYPKHYLVWLLTWVATIIQIFWGIRMGRKKKVETYTADIIGYTWLVFFIMMLLTGILIGSQLPPGQYYLGNILLLILYGMPTFLCGIILKFPPLVAGSMGCWLCAILAVILPHAYTGLFIGAAVLVAWIIPGYMLRNKYKKQNLSL